MTTNINTYTKKIPYLRRLVAGLLTICLFTFFLTSCYKETAPSAIASITIVHALPESEELAINFKAEGHLTYTKAGKLRNKGYMKTAYKDDGDLQRFRFFQLPDTAVKDAALFDLRISLPPASIHTLFLTGSLDAPDTLMTREEKIPFFPAGDSAMAIRFVNLSTDRTPISINLQGDAEGSEITNLGYKSMTAFKRFPVRQLMQDYVFEFHDAATGILLTSFTTRDLNLTDPNYWIFRSFTVVLTGKQGGAGPLAPAAFEVRHND